MDQIVDEFVASDAVGSLLAVRPQDSFHVVRLEGGTKITGFESPAEMNLRVCNRAI